MSDASTDWMLGRYDAKLEFITKLLEESREEQKVINARVAALEARFWWAAGIAAAFLFMSDMILRKLGLK